MGTLYLVRHGQASFGAIDYDQLSELGQQQSARLGSHWAAGSLQFDAVLCGSLKRQTQTWLGIAKGAGWTHEPAVFPALNEYDPQALIRSVYPGELNKPETLEECRQHFRWLREGLTRWMAGAAEPAGMPSYAEFVRGITSALDHVREQHEGQQVLLVSSAGPIGTAVGQVLGLRPERTIDLSMRIRNSAVTELQFSPKRYSLLTFNTLPHLQSPELAGWVTSA